MATCSTATLIEQACANNFLTAANDVLLYRAIKHQLLCNIFAGGGGGGGATMFTQLTDVPNSYVGQSLLSVRVNAAETGLEFFSIPVPAPDVIKFESPDIALNGIDTVYTIPHPLGAKPPMVNATLLCTANDAATQSVAGADTQLAGWFCTDSASPAFRVDSDAVNIYISVSSGDALVGNEGFYQVNRRDGQAVVNPTDFNNFVFKIYAWL